MSGITHGDSTESSPAPKAVAKLASESGSVIERGRLPRGVLVAFVGRLRGTGRDAARRLVLAAAPDELERLLALEVVLRDQVVAAPGRLDHAHRDVLVAAREPVRDEPDE